jgi:thiol-disulfide isomerase/thioredoxin
MVRVYGTGVSHEGGARATFKERSSGIRRSMVAVVVFAGLLLGMAACDRADVDLADGQRASWAQWDGKWIVINYWAEWCAPCRVEIPELNRLHRAGADAGVVVLGVNFDGIAGAGMDRLIDLFDIEFPILLADPGARWEQAKPSILPTTLVIDPEGKLHEVLVGPQTYESLAEAVGMVVEETPAPAPAGQPEA